MNKALAALHAGRLAEAERLFRRVLRAQPDHAEALHCLGIICHRTGDHARALQFLQRALRLDQSSSPLHNNHATVLNALRRPHEALASLDRALALNPGDATLHYNRGNTLMDLLRDEDALASFSRAVALNPALRPAWQNKAVIETRLGLYAAALATCDHLIALDPDEAQPRANRGDAPQADPEFALAHWNAASICLARGDFARGWREYEWRWHDPKHAARARRFSQPLWLGQQDLRGRTILLHAEQGFGDSIQFCRYAPMVRARGARVLLEAPAPLLKLLETLDGPHELIAYGQTLPAFDLHCPLMSLPLAFGTLVDTIPANIPYLAADPARLEIWRQRLGPPAGRRIGLAWSGSAAFTGDATRSAPLAALAPLVRPGLELISVQKDLRKTDRQAAATFGIRLFGDDLQDFADAAALIAQMDLVISVDTAPAHLAGALGVPVWLLLHQVAEWRWMTDRDDSPWYPTARLFRQTSARDWEGLIMKVVKDVLF